jgi:catechol 2,3-dioxygenase-like lactoylglutathione lyase family enzyme
MKATEPHTVKFGRVAPGIMVRDLQTAIDFYCGILGFEKTFENGSPAGFVILAKDSAEVHLTLSKIHIPSVQNVAHLMVSDARALYEHCIARDVRIIKALRDADFGLRCFVLADPDGNRIDVGEVI